MDEAYMSNKLTEWFTKAMAWDSVYKALKSADASGRVIKTESLTGVMENALNHVIKVTEELSA